MDAKLFEFSFLVKFACDLIVLGENKFETPWKSSNNASNAFGHFKIFEHLQNSQTQEIWI